MSFEIIPHKDFSQAFCYGAFYNICQRAKERANMAGHEKLETEFAMGTLAGDLYFQYASEFDRQFLLEVLREILTDDDFFTWPPDFPDPRIDPCWPYDRTLWSGDSLAVLKRRSIEGVTRLIEDLETVLKNRDAAPLQESVFKRIAIHLGLHR